MGFRSPRLFVGVVWSIEKHWESLRVSCAKTAEPIEMPFAWVTGVGVLDGV